MLSNVYDARNRAIARVHQIHVIKCKTVPGGTKL